METKIYNVDKFIKKYSNNEYCSHGMKEVAIFLNGENKGLFMDFECCGYDILGLDDDLEFGLEKISEQKPNCFSIVATYKTSVKVKDFLKKAEYRVIEHDKDFFFVDSKPRRQRNYKDMLKLLKELSIERDTKIVEL